MTSERQPDPDDLEAMASAILDGRAVDWAHSTPGSLVPELQDLERIVHFHHELAAALPGRATPAEWGHLRIIERIGSGVSADVFRAWDPRLDRVVALKLLDPSLGGPAGIGAGGVVHEARLLARVRHPNVVTVFGAEQRDGRIGIWTEFVEGETLSALVQTGGPLSVAQSVAIGLQLCDAVAAIHSAGVVHGDVKAQNVLRGRDGRIVLVDLGIGREPSRETPAAAPDLWGTPMYMAPELWRAGHATAACDIYSVGVLLYYLLTATFPFTGKTTADVRRAIAAGDRTPLRVARTDVPFALGRAIERALDPEPSGRWSSAAALRQALTDAVPNRGSVVRQGLVLAAYAVIVAALAAGVHAADRRGGTGRTDKHIDPPLVTQVTESKSGAITAAAISADGQRLLYGDAMGLFVQDIGADTARRLPWVPPQEITDVAWLPHPNEFVVAAGGFLWRGALGTPAARLLEDVYKVAVAPDGNAVAFTRPDGGLWTANLDGGRPTALIAPQTGVTFAKPSWSPDGDRIAYIRYDNTAPKRRLTIETIRRNGTGAAAAYTAQQTGLHQVLWAPDGRLLFTIPQPPPRARYTHVWQISIDAGTGAPLGPALQLTDYPDFNFTTPSITADGTRMTFVRNHFPFELRVSNFNESSSTLEEPRAYVAMNSEPQPLAWTPDGALLFRSAPLYRTVYIRPAGEIAPAEFVHDPRHEIFDAAVTADGRWAVCLGVEHGAVAVRRGTPGLQQLETLFSLATEDASLRCARARASVCATAVRNGETLTITAFDPGTGSTSLPIVASPVVSSESWDLSPDGSAVAIVPAAGAERVHVVDIASRTERDVSTAPHRGYGISWFADGTGWLITTTRGQGGDVVSVREGTTPHVLWSSDWQRLTLPFISADGRRVAFYALRRESTVWMLRRF